MGNDLEKPESSWLDALQELNLPKLILGPAGDALSRLVGSVADIPVEYSKSFVQGIRDKREARTEVSKALAKAVSSHVSADDALVERAAQSFLAKGLRAQSNKEGVARKAIEHLTDDPSVSDAKPATPDDDWLNVFERYAEDASSEKLRDVWGRVLAKEIRKPKTFSLRTLRFVSELDAETAQVFEKISGRIVNGEYIPKPTRLEGQKFLELLQLEDAGLLTGVNGDISQMFKGEGPMKIAFRFSKSAVLLECDAAFDFQVPAIRLTNIARELLKIIDPPDDPEAVREFADGFEKTAGMAKIALGEPGPAPNMFKETVMVWKRPA